MTATLNRLQCIHIWKFSTKPLLCSRCCTVLPIYGQQAHTTTQCHNPLAIDVQKYEFPGVCPFASSCTVHPQVTCYVGLHYDKTTLKPGSVMVPLQLHMALHASSQLMLATYTDIGDSREAIHLHVGAGSAAALS